MKRVFVLLFAMLVLGVIASPAFALGTGGYVEVCKAPNDTLNGTFQFTISDSTVGASKDATQPLTVNLAQGTCTAPIAVAPGAVKVTENGGSLGLDKDGKQVVSSEYLVTPTSIWVGKSTSGGPATSWDRSVTVPAGNTTDTVKVTFSNALQTGVIEVCKKVTDPSLTGTWSFTVTGANGFSTTTSTTPGNCSPAITLPAGHFIVQETGNSPSNAESVTSITATKTAGLTNVATLVNLPAATVVATVDVGDSSKQTIVTYTNNLVTFKLCKNYRGTSPAASYPFTLSTVAGSAGPNTPPATVSVAPGTCKDLGSYRAGTRILVTEGITPGTKVGAIDANQGIVSGTLNRPDRSVQVDLLAGETVVTYTDVPATDGLLKICKLTTLDSPVIPAGTVFAFTLTPVGGGSPATVNVTAGAPGTTQCSQPISSPFDKTWTVTEAARPNTVVTAITANLAKVVVVDNGTPTNTSQDVLTAVNLGARSANVTIGENNTTELTFTNKDPLPEPIIGGTSGGSSGGSGGAVVINPIAGLPALTPAAPFVPAVVKTNTSASANSAVQVSQLKKQLAALKTTQARLHKAFLHAKTKAAKNALAKRIGINKAHQKQIISQLQLLS